MSLSLPLIKYRVHGTLLNQPDELSMMEKLNFGRNCQNTLSVEWPKIANNAETVLAENSLKFRPKLLAVNPFHGVLERFSGRKLNFRQDLSSGR